MLQRLSTLAFHRQRCIRAEVKPLSIAATVIQCVNSGQSRNTYLHFNADELISRAAKLSPLTSLYSVPISLKDCFDLAHTRTTCGSRYYAELHPPTLQDSAMAQAIYRTGALLTGKTHLHPLAYGITGQNPDYGDCLQPRDAGLLTGGSSSGAAASVQEGSALAAIGTDTGGSIRVPAALCGLTGYRASHQLASPSGWFPDAWKGAAHLAPSFDTVGLLTRDPRDLAPLAQALFNIPAGSAPTTPRIGIVPESFLYDCETEVSAAYFHWLSHLQATGAKLSEIDVSDWNDTYEIFAAIQAHEAAEIHRGHYHHFEASIQERLTWGASLTKHEVEAFHIRLLAFRSHLAKLFRDYDYLALPAAPVARLRAGTDLSHARKQILRYTSPFSLGGLPAFTLPGEILDPSYFGTGIQIAGSPGADPALLAYAKSIGESLVTDSGKP